MIKIEQCTINDNKSDNPDDSEENNITNDNNKTQTDDQQLTKLSENVRYVTVSRQPVQICAKYIYMNSEKSNNSNTIEEYTDETARIIAQVMHYQNELQKNKCTNMTFSQIFNLKQGMKTFGSKGIEAANKEPNQLINRNILSPIHPYQLSTEERKHTLESLIFLTQKRMAP